MQLAVDVYLKVLHAKNIPQRLVDSLLNTVNGALDAIGNAKKQVRTNFDYVQKFNSLKTQLNVLIQQPEQFAIILADLTTFSDETIDPVFAFKEMNELINYKTGLVYPVVSSPIALMEQSNIVRTAQFQRQIALCGAALTIPDIRFTTYDAAIYAKNIIVDGSDIVLNDVDDDSLYIAIKDLITSVVGYINTTSVDLPKKQTISINSETNSLALSQKLYGNIDHEQEIIDLNNIVHPGFIPAGIDLEVLVYA
jgi:prophage DNA circulation protein